MRGHRLVNHQDIFVEDIRINMDRSATGPVPIGTVPLHTRHPVLISGREVDMIS
jgi:hypothetical protein